MARRRPKGWLDGWSEAMTMAARRPAVLLELRLPRIVDAMAFALIDVAHVAEGGAVGLGAKLFDLTIDLSEAFAHDCPPVSHYRLAARDKAWLRRLDAGAGARLAPDAPLALFSTEPDEPLDQAPARALRISVIGIVPAGGLF
jgi:hypothetical protein